MAGAALHHAVEACIHHRLRATRVPPRDDKDGLHADLGVVGACLVVQIHLVQQEVAIGTAGHGTANRSEIGGAGADLVLVKPPRRCTGLLEQGVEDTGHC
ncbi:hypothetical protein NQL31_000812 [Lotmaria passim]